MSKRRKQGIWALRHDLAEYVTTQNDRVEVIMTNRSQWEKVVATDGYLIEMSRKDARLLAKRINQCLDGTVKR